MATSCRALGRTTSASHPAGQRSPSTQEAAARRKHEASPKRGCLGGAKIKEAVSERRPLFTKRPGVSGVGDGRLDGSTVWPHLKGSTGRWSISTIHWFRCFTPRFFLSIPTDGRATKFLRLGVHFRAMDIEEAIGVLLFRGLIVAFIVVAAVIVVDYQLGELVATRTIGGYLVR